MSTYEEDGIVPNIPVPKNSAPCPIGHAFGTGAKGGVPPQGLTQKF